MKRDITNFVQKFLVCQQVKAEHKKHPGLLVPLSIPEWKWGHITMNFVTCFPRSLPESDAIWAVVGRLTKSAHFMPIRLDYSIDKLAQVYLWEIIKLHEYTGYPKSLYQIEILDFN